MGINPDDVSDYDDLLTLAGLEILVQVSDDDYDGDTRYALRGPLGYGLLVNGWGSCSGCDAFQAVKYDGEGTMDELQASMLGAIEWFDSLSGLKERVRSRDWEVHHSYRERETREFAEKVEALNG